MTALAAGTQRPEISDPTFDFGPQKGSTVIFQNALIMADTSGYLRPAAASVGGAYCIGVAIPRDFDLDRYDATGLSDGALTVQYRQGPHGFQNDGTNPILATTQPGTPVFAVDDQTVSLSSNGGLRPVAGRLRALDSTTVGGPVIVDVGKAIGAQLYQQMIGMEAVGAVLSVASNAIAPVYGIHHVGAGLIKNITVPAALANSGGTIALIPDAAFTTDATGNIAIASTAVIGKTMWMTYDPVQTKWYPSY